MRQGDDASSSASVILIGCEQSIALAHQRTRSTISSYVLRRANDKISSLHIRSSTMRDQCRA